MLSYLHSFHAGNRADVHKHQTLVRLLALLTAKPRPITYMETHAGRGLYDLAGPDAMKTGEAAEGIGRHLEANQGRNDDPYLDAVRAAMERHGASCYPGSPWIARHMLRQGDQLHLMELHPAEFPALKRSVGGANVHVHRRDGFEGVLAIAPPTPRRGLVLVDPSYETKDEYLRAARFIGDLHRKWPEAVILLWYPVLSAGRHAAMLEALAALELGEAQNDEVAFSDRHEGERMQGSGLYLVNPPFGFSL